VSIDRVKNPILYGGRPVLLELRVKVLKDWRNDENALQRLGYRMGKKKRK
jgi:GTPase Era involved in 16S rRNA processing